MYLHCDFSSVVFLPETTAPHLHLFLWMCPVSNSSHGLSQERRKTLIVIEEKGGVGGLIVGTHEEWCYDCLYSMNIVYLLIVLGLY